MYYYTEQNMTDLFSNIFNFDKNCFQEVENLLDDFTKDKVQNKNQIRDRAPRLEDFLGAEKDSTGKVPNRPFVSTK